MSGIWWLLFGQFKKTGCPRIIFSIDEQEVDERTSAKAVYQ